jgi:hypothetical protein
MHNQAPELGTGAKGLDCAAPSVARKSHDRTVNLTVVDGLYTEVNFSYTCRWSLRWLYSCLCSYMSYSVAFSYSEIKSSR